MDRSALRGGGNKNFTEWRCKVCSQLLGRAMHGNTVLRIKYRDLYVTVSGDNAVVDVNCFKCGSMNTVGPEEKIRTGS